MVVVRSRVVVAVDLLRCKNAVHDGRHHLARVLLVRGALAYADARHCIKHIIQRRLHGCKVPVVWHGARLPAQTDELDLQLLGTPPLVLQLLLRQLQQPRVVWKEEEERGKRKEERKTERGKEKEDKDEKNEILNTGTKAMEQERMR